MINWKLTSWFLSQEQLQHHLTRWTLPTLPFGPKTEIPTPNPHGPPEKPQSKLKELDLNLSREKRLWLDSSFDSSVGARPYPLFFGGEGDTHPLLVVAGFNQAIYLKNYAQTQIGSIFPQGKGKNSKNMFQTTIQLKNISFRNVALARCLKNQKWLLKKYGVSMPKSAGDSFGGVIYAEKNRWTVKIVLLSLKFTFSNALLQRSLPILASSFY